MYFPVICSFPAASNETLLNKFTHHHKNNLHYQVPQLREGAFSIMHYAGRVKYFVKVCYLPACLPACLCTCLPACLPAYLPTGQLTWLPTCLPTCLPPCSYLSDCVRLLVFLSACLLQHLKIIFQWCLAFEIMIFRSIHILHHSKFALFGTPPSQNVYLFPS